MSTDAEQIADLSFGDFLVARADERLIGPNGPVRLGRKAYQVLLLLAESEGRLVTKDALFDSVWDGLIVSESALTSVVKELRRALDDQSGQPRYIESVYGRGYRFLPEVGRRAPGDTHKPKPAVSPAVDARPAPLGEAPLLAVPPFDDSAVADTEPHLGAVLHEEMLVTLSRFRDLRLVPGKEFDGGGGRFGERDYRLNVRLVRDADGIRAFSRISRLAAGEIIWADQVQLAASNPLQAVESLARRVAGVALPRLHDDVLRHLPEKAGDAFDLYYQLRLRMRGLDRIDEAREVAAAWERLIAEHPEFIQAYPQLIRLYNTDFGYTGIPATTEVERKRAYELAHRALAMDPTDSHLHTVKGWCHLRAGESVLAGGHLEEAARLNPYHQSRLVELATGYMFLEDFDRASELLERCRSLSALTTEAPNEEEGLLHLLREDYSRAAESLVLARCTHPDDDRAMARPSIMSEFYALLAAIGTGASDIEARAGHWSSIVLERWVGPQAADSDQLTRWVMSHHPFRTAERRGWMEDRIRGALALMEPAIPRTPAPARPEKPSARPRAAPGPA